MEDIYQAMRYLDKRVTRLEQEMERSRKKPQAPFHEWIDGQEVMQALHISPRTLQTLRTSGKLIPTRLLRKYYYKTSDIKDLLEANYIRNHLTKRR